MTRYPFLSSGFVMHDNQRHLLTCTYEQPLNERMRLFMRLESMFLQMHNFHSADEYYSIQLFLDALFDVLDFLHRYEIRAEVIKELQRYQIVLKKGKNDEQSIITEESLQMLTQVDASLKEVLDINFNPISALRENELFNSLRQRNFNQSGNCLFEVPAYQYWLMKHNQQETSFLDHCYQLFSPIEKAINIILKLVRMHSQHSEEYTEDGMFIMTLDTRQRNQMLRVHLPMELDVFPRISGDKHRFSIRFMTQENPEVRAQQINHPVTFNLQMCIL